MRDIFRIRRKSYDVAYEKLDQQARVLLSIIARTIPVSWKKVNYEPLRAA